MLVINVEYKDFDFSSINKNKTYAVLMIDCGEIVIEINNNVSPNNSKRFKINCK